MNDLFARWAPTLCVALGWVGAGAQELPQLLTLEMDEPSAVEVDVLKTGKVAKPASPILQIGLSHRMQGESDTLLTPVSLTVPLRQPALRLVLKSDGLVHTRSNGATQSGVADVAALLAHDIDLVGLPGTLQAGVIIPTQAEVGSNFWSAIGALSVLRAQGKSRLSGGLLFLHSSRDPAMGVSRSALQPDVTWQYAVDERLALGLRGVYTGRSGAPSVREWQAHVRLSDVGSLQWTLRFGRRMAAGADDRNTVTVVAEGAL